MYKLFINKDAGQMIQAVTITFSNETIFECQPCQNGTYSEEGASFCIMCEPGFYSERGASKCEKCPKGTISSHHGASHCNNCHAGEYPNENQNDCIPCEPGSYSNEGVQIVQNALKENTLITLEPLHVIVVLLELILMKIELIALNAQKDFFLIILLLQNVINAPKVVILIFQGLPLVLFVQLELCLMMAVLNV